MSKSRKFSLLASVLCIGAWVASSAQARTIYAGAGESLSTTSRSRFGLLETGVIVSDATAANPFVYVVPVTIDTAGNKLFGARGNANGLSCFVRQRPTVVADVPLPVTAPGVALQLRNVNVIAGNSVWVQCTFTSSSARLLLIDHQS